MGPFDEDIRRTIYEMLMMEGTYGWIEVDGIKDKTAGSTVETYKKGVRDLLSNTGQGDRHVARVHTDEGQEFKGELNKKLIEDKTIHTTTGGYNSIIIIEPSRGAIV